MSFQHITHRRYNPLLGQWVKVSPHRTDRPWQGQKEQTSAPDEPSYEPSCYLCPGNSRAGEIKNPEYSSTYSFDNDFAALRPDQPPKSSLAFGPNNILSAYSERGICRVLCFSPFHNRTIARMTPEEITGVVHLWKKEYQMLSQVPWITHIQIFENRGHAMGCSNPHPHGQIWADEFIPDIPLAEYSRQNDYFQRHDTFLLSDYHCFEQKQNERLVYSNESWTVLVPYWAVWPFETMIIPKRNIPSLEFLTEEEISSLADAVGNLCIRYDNLFESDFPYSMGIHQAPVNCFEYQGVLMHLHYYPPLLRGADIRKFMVGYEMLAMPQRDLTAEESANRLAALPGVHYTKRKE